jgi:hypothetical protein
MNIPVHILGALLVVSTAIAGILSIDNAAAKAPRPCDCACEELRRIRLLLENQFQVVCNERRCLPAPTPTGTPNGGPLE